jgi:hypothetical protein
MDHGLEEALNKSKSVIPTNAEIQKNQRTGFPLVKGMTAYSISKSFVTRRQAADSAMARQGEVDKVTDDFEME